MGHRDLHRRRLPGLSDYESMMSCAFEKGLLVWQKAYWHQGTWRSVHLDNFSTPFPILCLLGWAVPTPFVFSEAIALDVRFSSREKFHSHQLRHLKTLRRQKWEELRVVVRYYLEGSVDEKDKQMKRRHVPALPWSLVG